MKTTYKVEKIGNDTTVIESMADYRRVPTNIPEKYHPELIKLLNQAYEDGQKHLKADLRNMLGIDDLIDEKVAQINEGA